MATYSVMFDVIKSRREISVKCKKCGKKLKRVLTSEMTVNPFNVRKDGVPKTAAEVRRDADADVEKSDRWKVQCGQCERTESLATLRRRFREEMAGKHL